MATTEERSRLLSVPFLICSPRKRKKDNPVKMPISQSQGYLGWLARLAWLAGLLDNCFLSIWPGLIVYLAWVDLQVFALVTFLVLAGVLLVVLARVRFVVLAWSILSSAMNHHPWRPLSDMTDLDLSRCTGRGWLRGTGRQRCQSEESLLTLLHFLLNLDCSLAQVDWMQLTLSLGRVEDGAFVGLRSVACVVVAFSWGAGFGFLLLL